MSERLRGRLESALDLALTPEQRMVVFEAPCGPAVVIAGAGSGKTSVMAARIVAQIVIDEVPGDSVMGLTFTRKAAGELATRVDRYLRAAQEAGLLSAHGGEPLIATYHSFAQHLVRDHGLRAGIDPDLRVQDELAMLPLAYRVVSRAEGLRVGEHALTVSSAVSGMRMLDGELAEHLVEPAALIAQEEARLRLLDESGPADVRRMRQTSLDRIALAGLVTDYREAKLYEGVMDYADMQRLAFQVASTPAVRALVRAQVSSVLLDEYQDTSVVQRLLLQELFGGGHRVLAVGDPRQAIYGFRGAAADNIGEFPGHFPDAEGAPARVFTLSVNFRSGPTVVAVANDAPASRAATGDAPGLVAGRDDVADTVEAHLFQTRPTEEGFVVDEVVAELRRGRPAAEVLVLARSNDAVARLAEALVARGVPVTSSAGGGVFDAPEVLDLLAELAVVVDPGANGELARLLIGPRWRIGVRDLALLGERARRIAAVAPPPAADQGLQASLSAATAGTDPVDVPSLADALADPGDADFSTAALARFAALHAELSMLSGHAGDPLPDLLARIARTTGLATEVLLGPDADRRSATVDAVIATAREFESSSPGSGPTGFLRAVRLARAAGADPGGEPPSLPGRVRVMTVHKAKGLEADVVFLPGMSHNDYDKADAKGFWGTQAGRLPADLRGDHPAGPLLAPASPSEVEELREQVRQRGRAEGHRVLYVALTRARQRLVATSHVWTPGTKNPRPPAAQLVALAERAGVVRGTWYDVPDGEVNPLAAEELHWEFPHWDVHATERRVREAAAVTHAGQAGRDPASAVAVEEGFDTDADGPSEWVREQITAWGADVAALRRERQAALHSELVVRLPQVLSVSAAQGLLADEERFALDLRRPMPRRPSRAAGLGTRFHEWVARRWDQRPLIDPDDWAADAGVEGDDEELAPLVAAFESSEYADRRPDFIEYPFEAQVAGVVVRGRIDAVYRTAEGWEVVDWKTSRASQADSTQLALYRLAWARVKELDPATVAASFYYVRRGERVPLVDPPDEADLAAQLRAAISE